MQLPGIKPSLWAASLLQQHQEQTNSPLRMQKSLFASQTLTVLSLSSTTRDTVLNGYYVPKDRCVFVNQWQVNHDE